MALRAKPPAGIFIDPKKPESEWAAENEEGAERDEAEADQVVQSKGFLQDQDGEAREDHERDDLLNGLELGGGIDRVADPVGGNGEAVFDEGDTPADEDDQSERRVREPEMAVPCHRHEDVGGQQHQDGRQVRRAQSRYPLISTTSRSRSDALRAWASPAW